MTAYLSSGVGPSAAPAGQPASRRANARIALEVAVEGIAQTGRESRLIVFALVDKDLAPGVVTEDFSSQIQAVDHHPRAIQCRDRRGLSAALRRKKPIDRERNRT